MVFYEWMVHYVEENFTIVAFFLFLVVICANEKTIRVKNRNIVNFRTTIADLRATRTDLRARNADLQATNIHLQENMHAHTATIDEMKKKILWLETTNIQLQNKIAVSTAQNLSSP